MGGRLKAFPAGGGRDKAAKDKASPGIWHRKPGLGQNPRTLADLAVCELCEEEALIFDRRDVVVRLVPSRGKFEAAKTSNTSPCVRMTNASCRSRGQLNITMKAGLVRSVDDIRAFLKTNGSAGARRMTC